MSWIENHPGVMHASGKSVIREQAGRRIGVVVAVFLCAAVAVLSPMATAVENEIDDSDITRAIERDLFFDELVSAHLIDVSTIDGIVTLSGSVDNLLAKDHAVNIAEAITGVRAVVDKMVVKPIFLSDGEILTDVESALLLDPATDSYEIDIEVKDGVVTLSGTVDSWAEKQLCIEVAKGIRGVKDVQDKITVDWKTERHDHEIEIEVQRKLSLDPYVHDSLIEVNVMGGVVVLSGMVGSAAEKTRAYNDSWVNGVAFVDTRDLDIERVEGARMRRASKFVSKPDEEVRQAINDAFLYDPRVRSFDIDVDVSKGVVTLAGIVDNLKAKKAAEQDAKNTIGVWRVRSYVKVRPLDSFSDAEIARKTHDALLRDAILHRYDFKITVLNQKAYIYGTVDTYYDKYRAEDVVSGVPGVVDVQNDVDVLYAWRWKSDVEIKEDVESELFWSIFVDSDDISVSVDDGVVMLTGTVDSWQELHAAVENAFEGGARSVRSRLKVANIPEYDQDLQYDLIHRYRRLHPWHPLVH